MSSCPEVRGRVSEFGAAQTLVERVQAWAVLQPDNVAYLTELESREQSLTYGELHRRARAIAGRLRMSSRAGATAILLYPLGLEFVEAFFGCLFAGIVAVPLPPARGKGASVRLSAVARDCRPSAILTTSRLASDSP